MRRKVIHDQEIPLPYFFGQDVADVAFKYQRIHRAIQDQRRNKPFWCQHPNQCAGFPMAMWLVDGEPLSLGCVTPQGVHVGGEAGFIQHDQAAGFLSGNPPEP